MGAVLVGLEVTDNILGICKCLTQKSGIKRSIYTQSHVSIILKPASPVSAPHSRIAAMTVNKGRRVAICSRDMFTSEPFLHTII